MIFTSILILIVAIALPSFKKDLSSLLIPRISAIIFIYSGALALNAFYIQSIGSGIGIYSGLFQVTIASQLLDVVLLFLGALTLMSWPLISSFYYNKVLFFKTLLIGGNTKSLSKTKFNFIGLYTPRTEYCLIVLFSALGSSFIISSSDFISMFLSIELQSFGLYILATIYKDSKYATSAGLKYFLLGSLSSCLILLGSGLIYSFTGLTNFESMYSLISSSIPSITAINSIYSSISHQILSGVSLGLIFIFIGLLFKISAAPFHSWSPEVYDETPTQVTIWLTLIPKIAILSLLLELNSGITMITLLDIPFAFFVNNVIYNVWDLNIIYILSYVLKILLLISSLLSLVIGTILGLAQIRIKRLFAYSTVTHMGFILLALAINTEQSIDSFIFYIIQYSITNLNVFLIILSLGFILNRKGVKFYYQEKVGKNNINIYFFDFDIRKLVDFKGLLFQNSILSLSLVICVFSMAGIPPFLGFFAKQFVLLSAIESGYWFITVVAILTSIISAAYYLRIVAILVTHTPTTSKTKVINNNSLAPPSTDAGGTRHSDNSEIISDLHCFLISTLTLLIILFMFKPTLLLNSTQLLALSLFYT